MRLSHGFGLLLPGRTLNLLGSHLRGVTPRMSETRTSLETKIELALPPKAAFETLTHELELALADLGMTFEGGKNGVLRTRTESAEIGRVVEWEPGRRVRLEWHSAPWKPGEVTEVELRFLPTESGTEVILEHRGWGGVLGDGGGERTGWFASQVVAPLFRAWAPDGLGNWITDRVARRPTGNRSREVYRDPTYHRPNFMAILKELSLTSDDNLLEVGCGGGAFLHDALQSGCRATAIDHSPEMIRLAAESNRDAVVDGRLRLLESEADRLPLPDATFSCAVSTGVFGFLPKPVETLREIHRTLAPRGRLVVFGSSKELRGTPAAPEPVASRVNFYEPEEVREMAQAAGFAEVRVVVPDLGKYARESGVPEEALPLFTSGVGGWILLARRS